MTVVDEVRTAVERSVPAFSDRAGDWAGVLAGARVEEPRRARGRWAVAVVAAVLAAAALALLWPANREGEGILDRARAAVATEPVVHVVLRGAPIRVYDLERHAYRTLTQTHEEWYDPSRGVHTLRTVGGRIGENLYLPDLPARFPDGTQPYAGVATVYRRALAAGDASLGPTDTVQGRRIHWIRFDVEYPFGIRHHEVAVDAETFEPRLLRVDDGPVATVLSFETLPRGAGNFEPGPAPPSAGERWSGAATPGPRSPAEARTLLRGALWLGERFEGLPLAGIREVTRPKPEHLVPVGETVWRSLELCYGEEEQCRVSLILATQPEPLARPGRVPRPDHPWPFDPAPGLVAFAEGDRGLGFTTRDGIFVTLVARNREEVIAAAEALRPIQ